MQSSLVARVFVETVDVPLDVADRLARSTHMNIVIGSCPVDPAKLPVRR